MSKIGTGAVLSVALGLLALPARCDVISPHVNARGKRYSDERPNSSYYGKGIGGRLMEASALRFEGTQALEEKRIDEAVRKLAKAVQLDPEHPTGHVLYARAITAQLYANEGAVDEELLKQCIDEWKLIWRHDADLSEQAEARVEARRLMKIARALNKKKKERARALIAEQKREQALHSER